MPVFYHHVIQEALSDPSTRSLGLLLDCTVHQPSRVVCLGLVQLSAFYCTPSTTHVPSGTLILPYTLGQSCIKYSTSKYQYQYQYLLSKYQYLASKFKYKYQY